MNLTKVQKRINLYQENPVFHELTCGNNSKHGTLKAQIIGDKVVLICPDCEYIQTYIPDFFFNDQFEIEYNKQKELMDRINEIQNTIK